MTSFIESTLYLNEGKERLHACLHCSIRQGNKWWYYYELLLTRSNWTVVNEQENNCACTEHWNGISFEINTEFWEMVEGCLFR